VQRIHRGEDASAEVRRLRTGARTLARAARRQSAADEHLAFDALQECVEAILLDAIVAGRALPGPSALGVAPEPFLSGVADLSGELRRLTLHRLSGGDLKGAEHYLRLMEQVHDVLMRFETARSILVLKPKQDTSRALVERTRGEVTLARVLARSSVPAPRPVEEEA
jgi:translin